jgi:hypothetical protein
LLRAPDVYKLIHQGVFGPGHMFVNEQRVRARLKDELQELANQVKGQGARVTSRSPVEGLIEEIDPRGKLVRVNLGSMVAAQSRMQTAECKMQNVSWVAEAMVESARRVKGDHEQMRRRLAAAVRWCRKNLPRQAGEFERLAARAEDSGYPAFHHSSAYARAYSPAYRVILARCLGKNSRRSQRREAGS